MGTLKRTVTLPILALAGAKIGGILRLKCSGTVFGLLGNRKLGQKCSTAMGLVEARPRTKTPPPPPNPLTPGPYRAPWRNQISYQ